MNAKTFEFSGIIKNNFVVFAVISFIIGGFLFFGDIAQAATLDVDGATGNDATGAPYQTIQAAINAAASGDTINVAAGTYSENIELNKALVLFGANHDVDPVGSIDRGGESIITGQVKISATATFNGFKLTGNQIVISGADGITASYNIILNSVYHGIYIEPSSPNAQVIYNTVSSSAWQGISNQGNSGVIISYNHIVGAGAGGGEWTTRISIESTNHLGTEIEISSNTISGGSKGINYWGGDGALISGNSITDTSIEGIYLSAGHFDDMVSGNTIVNAGAFPIYVGTRAEISGNTISNSIDGIRVDYMGSSVTDRVEVVSNTVSYTKYAGINVFGSNTYIHGNTVHNANYYGSDGLGDWDYAAIHLEASAINSIIDNNIVYDSANGIQTWADDVVITNNEVYDMGVTYKGDGDGTKTVDDIVYKNSGILVGSVYGDNPSGVVVNNNKIHDNCWGLFYSSDLTNGVAAENNWWGAISGPTHASNGGGTGNEVSDNVDFRPWFTNEAMTATRAYNVTIGEIGYESMQAAINAATSSDTINVAAGTYTIDSSINVNKSVTITTDTSATIVSTVLDTPVFNITADNVRIEKFNITTNVVPFSNAGAVTGSETSGALVLINGQNAVIDNNVIYTDESSLGEMATWTARGITLQTGSATISNNTIYGVRNGIIGRPGVTANINNNVIFNTKGGIMNYTSGQADASNRTVSNNSWTSTVTGMISHNEWDIVWNTAYYVPDYQQSVVAMSLANNSAYVVDRRTVDATYPTDNIKNAAACASLTGNRSHIFVNTAGTSTAGPTNGNINLPYATVALGISAVVPGGTISVAAGTYTENLTINKSLVLTGPNAIINPNSETPRETEAIISGLLTISANDVDVKGFTITNPTGTYGVQITEHTPSITGVNLTYNIFNSIGGSGNVKGIYLVHGPDNVTIAHNLFSNISAVGTKSADGIFVGDSNSTDPSNGVIIQDNAFNGISSVAKGAYGILVNDGAGTGVQILDNVFSNLSGGWTHAIGLEGPTENAVVSRNTFGNLTATGADKSAIFFEDNQYGNTCTVSQNKFNGDGFFGVAIHPDDVPGGANDYSYVVNATENWWSSAVKSEIQSKISGDVAFVPYYITSDMNTLSDSKMITGFTVPGQTGSTVINKSAHKITLTVPSGADVTHLVPTITLSGDSVAPDSGVEQDFTSPVIYTVSAIDETIQDYTVVVTVLSATQTVPDTSGNVTVDVTTPEVIITNPDQAVNVAISSDAVNPTIDVGSLITGGAGTLPAITITSANANNANVAIPASTNVTSADPAWNGVIAAPTVTTVILPATVGQNKNLSSAIEVGFSGAKLSFDKAVRLLLPGQAGKRAGYIRTGTAFTEITNVCAADSQAAGDALAADGDCKIDVGADLVIWTKHFTKFATYTVTDSSPNAWGGSVSSAASTPSASGASSVSSPQTPKFDVNKDGKVGISDFNALMVDWSGTSLNNAVDFNGDNKVDIFDFNLLMVNWTI